MGYLDNSAMQKSTTVAKAFGGAMNTFTPLCCAFPTENKPGAVSHCELTPHQCPRSCWNACAARWTPAWAARSTRAPTPLPCTPNLTVGQEEMLSPLCWHTGQAELCTRIYNSLEFHTWLSAVSWTINSSIFLLMWKNINLLKISKIPTVELAHSLVRLQDFSWNWLF